jgi:hypothetical protein
VVALNRVQGFGIYADSTETAHIVKQLEYLLRIGKEKDVIDQAEASTWERSVKTIREAARLHMDLPWKQRTNEESTEWWRTKRLMKEEESLVLRVERALLVTKGCDDHAYGVLDKEGFLPRPNCMHDHEVVDRLLELHTWGVRSNLIWDRVWDAWTYGMRFFNSRPIGAIYSPEVSDSEEGDLQLIDINKIPVWKALKMTKWPKMLNPEFFKDEHKRWLNDRVRQFGLDATGLLNAIRYRQGPGSEMVSALDNEEPRYSNLAAKILALTTEPGHEEQAHCWLMKLEERDWPKKSEKKEHSEISEDDDRMSDTDRVVKELQFSFETLRGLLQGFDPSTYLPTHYKQHWSLCYDHRCIVHL